MAANRQTGGKIDGGCRFANATFLIRNAKSSGQLRFPGSYSDSVGCIRGSSPAVQSLNWLAAALTASTCLGLEQIQSWFRNFANRR